MKERVTVALTTPTSDRQVAAATRPEGEHNASSQQEDSDWPLQAEREPGASSQQADSDGTASRQEGAGLPDLVYVLFTSEDVGEAIREMPTTSSPGPDAITPCLLRKAKGSLSRMLANIYQHSMENGDIPQLWRDGFIAPVHKGGSTSLPENFRPVSLASHVTKTQERVVRRRIVTFLEAQNRFDPNQHGSRYGRSTLSQLLEHHYEIVQILERDENVDVLQPCLPEM